MRSGPKMIYLRHLFRHYFEPLDVIDRFARTHIFENAGMRIRSVEGDVTQRRTERVDIFMDCFEETSCQESGSFQHLLDVLNSAPEYKWIVPILDDSGDNSEFYLCLQKLDKPGKLKDILQHLMSALKIIDASEVIEHMRKYLTDDDRERLKKFCEHDTNSNAVYHLLHKLIYKKPGWTDHFIHAIKDLGYTGQHEMFKGVKDYEGKALWEILQDYLGCFNMDEVEEEEMMITEDPEPMLESAQLKHTPKWEYKDTYEKTKCSEIDKPACRSEKITSEAEDQKEKLRNYQKELSKTALTGENVVICAPTNSGKTFVAAHIIENHLKHGSTGHKVIFFTPTGGLAEQQFLKLQRYLDHLKDSVTLLHGSMEDRIEKDMQKIIYSHDVIVMTPQILLNCLKKKAVKSIFDFSMFIFDECHHSRLFHPYCEILRIYDEEASGTTWAESTASGHVARSVSSNQNDQRAIQIIGLTATLGIGGATNDEEATENIFMLLAVLKASGLSLVREHEDELNRICPAVEEKQEYVEHGDDEFKNIIKNTISKILAILKGIKGTDQLSTVKNQPPANLSKDFNAWCLRLRHAAEECIDGKTDDSDGSINTCGRDTKSCADTLLNLTKANELCRNCHASDAIGKIEQFMQERFTDHKEKNTDLENRIYEELESALQDMGNCVDQAENEMLNILESKIKQKMQEDADFRCMVMVSRRLYAACLQRWIENSKVLKGLGSRLYIGVGSKGNSDTQGLTHKKQAQAIESFAKGECKVLVCTPDAAGEGIDIQNCNLVVTVECIRDEIKKVQLAGRARKENSEVVHIHFKKSDESRDSLPLEKVKMMKRVTKQIHKMYRRDNPKYCLMLKNGKQKVIKKIMQVERKKRKIMPKRHGQDSLLCRRCSLHICSTNCLFKINGSHHTVNDTSFNEKYMVTQHKQFGDEIRRTGMTHVNRIRCAECKCEWGNEVAWKGCLVPILTPVGFKIKDLNGKVHCPSKWKRTGMSFPARSFNDCKHLFREAPLEVSNVEVHCT